MVSTYIYIGPKFTCSIGIRSLLVVNFSKNNMVFLFRFMEPLVYGSYPEIMRRLVKDRLPHFTKEEEKMINGSLGFVGINYYSTRYGRNVPAKPQGPISYSDDLLALALITSKFHNILMLLLLCVHGRVIVTTKVKLIGIFKSYTVFSCYDCCRWKRNPNWSSGIQKSIDPCPRMICMYNFALCSFHLSIYSKTKFFQPCRLEEVGLSTVTHKAWNNF